MIRQEVGTIAALLFINGSTRFADPVVEPLWRAATRGGVFPSEFPHDPQHVGAEG